MKYYIRTVVEVADEVVAVVRRERHESPAHKDELHLVHRVPQLAQLVNPLPRLHVGAVPRPDRAHARRLVPCVGLRAVLEIRVRPARAVDADVACGCNVRAAVGLGHYRHHRDPRSRAHGLGSQLREECGAVLIRYGRDNLDELGGTDELVSLAGVGLDPVEVDVGAGLDPHEHLVHYVGDGSHARLVLGYLGRLHGRHPLAHAHGGRW
mmetsp:Transcript_50033/g.160117  ORF Transcript_50033/g.160117 Transcript_50033/m.160117 type:complete len:209 (-) Transcript_50033:55-681(-)